MISSSFDICFSSLVPSISPISSLRRMTSSISALSLLLLTARLDFSIKTAWCLIASRMSDVFKTRFGVFFHSSGSLMFSLFKSGYLMCLSEKAAL